MTRKNIPAYAGLWEYNPKAAVSTNEMTIIGCRIIDITDGLAVLRTVLSDHGARTARFKIPPGSTVTITSSRIGLPSKEEDMFFGRSPIMVEETAEKPADFSYIDVKEVDEAIKGLCPSANSLSSNNKEYLAQMIQCYLESDCRQLEEICRLTNSSVLDFLKGTKELAEAETNGCVITLFERMTERAKRIANRFDCD